MVYIELEKVKTNWLHLIKMPWQVKRLSSLEMISQG